MKKLHRNKLNKIIVLSLAVIMLCSFVMPKRITAVSTENGGSAVEPLAKFLCYIPDAVNNVLQHMFVSTMDIEIEENDEIKEYSILYSPKIIFSGKVPAFDINFIQPTEAQMQEYYHHEYKYVTFDANRYSFDENNSFFYNAMRESTYLTDFVDEFKIDLCKILLDFDVIECNNEDYIWLFENVDVEDVDAGFLTKNAYIETLKDSGFELKNYITVPLTANTLDQLVTEYKIENERVNIYIKEVWKQEYDQDNVDVIHYYLESYSIEDDYPAEPREYESSARILQPIVASWYKALRRIALVGLLSVLVYIGIRIVLSSSSAKEKAKYKKMLKNWFQALCLLFMLHYIMSFTIFMVNQINSIIGTSGIGAEGEDLLLTSLRNRILNAGEWAEVLAEVVIYVVITVYTVLYTIKYFKRTIYLAFLTAIAPLITLTYPLDKIKDNKSQAFDMWLKDYIFFSLLQVLHGLIYHIFVSQALELSEIGTKWSLIYSITVIGFITHAEKIMKKMFGFQKSKSLGTMEAGVTGALIMNLFNKGSWGKMGSSAKGTGATNGGSVRTSNGKRTTSSKPLETLQTAMADGTLPLAYANNQQPNGGENGSEGANNQAPENGEANLNRGAQGGSQGGAQGSAQGATQGGAQGGTPVRIQARNTPPMVPQNANSYSQGSNRGTNGNPQQTSGTTDDKEARQIARKRVIRGLKALGKRYLRPAVAKTGGVLLGGAGALIGFSAGAAQGDISKALGGVVTGGAAGYYGGQKLVNSGLDAAHTVTHLNERENTIVDTYNEGARGKEYVQNRKFDRAFRASDDYQRLMDENPKTPDEYIQKMLDANITEYKDMDRILKKHKEHPRKYSIDKAIGYATLAKECPNSILFNDKKFIRYCQDRDIEITPEEAKAVRKVLVEFK